MPFQLVNESTIEPSAGSQIRKMWMNAGMPTIRASVVLSRRVSRLKRRLLRCAAVDPPGGTYAPPVSTGGAYGGTE